MLVRKIWYIEAAKKKVIPRARKNMPIIRTTIYLKSGSGAKPLRTYYFSEEEYQRLQQDYAQYQQHGAPQLGTYREEVSETDEHSVMIEFAALAEIRTNQ